MLRIPGELMNTEIYKQDACLAEAEEDLPFPEEAEEARQARMKRAQDQLQQYGRASLKNRRSMKEIADAMERSGGLTSNVCKILDCTYREFSVLLSSSKDLGKRWQDIRKQIVSRAEHTMVDALCSKNETTRFNAAKYILDRLGASEGYGQIPQTAITVENGDKKTTIKAIFGINE